MKISSFITPPRSTPPSTPRSTPPSTPPSYVRKSISTSGSSIEEPTFKKSRNSIVQNNALESDLYTACEFGNTENVMLLLSENVDLDTPNYSGETPLMRAYYNGSKQIFTLLLKSGANSNIKNKSGQSLLHFACAEGDFETVRLLIGHGAEVCAQDNQNENALHKVLNFHKAHIKSNYIKIIQLLLENKININLPNLNGYTPLYFACENQDIEQVELLIKNNADVNIKNKIGQSCLDRMALFKNYNIMELLLQCGAEVNLEYLNELNGFEKTVFIDGSEEEVLQFLKLRPHQLNIEKFELLEFIATNIIYSPKDEMVDKIVDGTNVFKKEVFPYLFQKQILKA